MEVCVQRANPMPSEKATNWTPVTLYPVVCYRPLTETPVIPLSWVATLEMQGNVYGKASSS